MATNGTREKYLNEQVWQYNEADGWYTRKGVVLSRSEENKNVWVRWDGANYRAGTRHSRLAEAAAGIRSL